MMRDDRTTTPNTTTRGTTPAGARGLAHLNDLDDFKVADGEPDIRGWKVKSADGKELGKVDDLLVDTGAMKVRYIVLEVGKNFVDRKTDDRHMLIPIGTARLDDKHDDVLLSTKATDIVGVPGYQRDRFDRNYESSLLAGYGAKHDKKTDADFYGHGHFDDRQFYGNRKRNRADASYITRSEEELTTGKRKVQAGEVDVRKTVETEHVREKVPVMHEEVTVERRPVSAADAPRDAHVGADEIRVPVMAEEVVTEKRVVPKEELVIKKHAVQGEEVVEADLKKERVDVDKSGKNIREDRGRDLR